MFGLGAITQHHNNNNLFNKTTYCSQISQDTQKTFSLLNKRTCFLHSPYIKIVNIYISQRYVVQYRLHGTDQLNCWKAMVQTIRPEWGLRKRSEELVAVWRVGKGKQVQQEIKISNPVHVSGFEAHHGTLFTTSFLLSLQSHCLLSSLVYLLLHPVSPVLERPSCPLFRIWH